MAHEFCWIEMTTDNTEAAKSFYSELFGWSYDNIEMDQGGTYSSSAIRRSTAAD